MKCPVCHREYTVSLCPGCGYDHSRDYEAYPTFAPIGGGHPARSRLDRDYNDLMHCSRCGSSDLHFRFADRNLSCTRCGHLLSPREMDTLLAIMGCTPLLHQPAPAAPPPPREEPSAPRRITAIAAGYCHTAALYSDGTVRAIGLNREGQCDTSRWRDIIAIAAGSDTTVGLKRDGTIISTKHYTQRDLSCTGITAVTAGGAGIACIKQDGSIVLPWSAARAPELRGVISIDSSWSMILGVKDNGGTTILLGDEPFLDQVRNWLNLTQIAVGFNHAVGLRQDHSVVCAGDNLFRQCETEDWHDIVAVSAGDNHTVGLRADGTAAAAGVHADGRCNVTNWNNVTAIAAGGFHTVALCSDGKLLATGSNKEGQCAISRLMVD